MENNDNKMTKDDIIKALQNINTDFLYDVPAYKEQQKIVDNYQVMRENAEMELGKNSERIDNMVKKLNIKTTSEYLGEEEVDYYQGHTLYQDFYCVNMYMGNNLIHSEKTSSSHCDKLLWLMQFVKIYEEKQSQYSKIKNNESYWTKKCEEIRSNITVCKSANIFYKLTHRKSYENDIEMLESDLKSFETHLSNLKELRKYLNELEGCYNQVKENEFEIKNILNTYKEAYSKFKSDSRYAYISEEDYIDEYKKSYSAEQEMMKMAKSAKEFETIKLYKQNESSFDDHGAVLEYVFKNNLSEEFNKNFEKLLSIYDKAIDLAKADNFEFEKLDEGEQFEYFMNAQKVAEKSKEFDNHDKQ